ncbi:MAG: DUF3800 domain-containing protein [Candidatus ainarchaeum sp.]|nr:DUF3800 domain-containing protein [Candidatus ainarchaeum sp.]
MFAYIYIDESGDLGDRGSKHLVLAALVVEDYKVLDRIIKNMRRNKFKKELRGAHEIKANKSSDSVIRYMLEKVNELKNARVFYMVLEKKKLFSEYLRNDKNKLYNFIAGKLAKNLPMDKGSISIRVDKSKGRQMLQEDFNAYFMKNLKRIDSRITIEHSYSHAWSGLQFADILAWSCFQKFEHGDSGYIDIIKIEQEVYQVW